MNRIQEIVKSLAEVDEETTLDLVKAALKEGTDPIRVIEDGLVAGMRVIGEKFEKFEIFLPEMMMAGDIMTHALAVIQAALPAGSAEAKKKKLVVIGTAPGDIHNIGKNLVARFLELAGFEVHDLGEDVPMRQFVDKAKELNADIIAVSALMTTSMGAGGEITRYLEDGGIRKQFKVMLGGSPVTEEDATRMGADGWSADAVGAAVVATELVKEEA
jgi:dimethylamine corrinoid protein